MARFSDWKDYLEENPQLLEVYNEKGLDDKDISYAQQTILGLLETIQHFAPKVMNTPWLVLGEIHYMFNQLRECSSSPYYEEPAPIVDVTRILKLQELSDDHSILQFTEEDHKSSFLRLELIAQDMLVVLENHNLNGTLSGEGGQMLAILMTEFMANWGVCRAFEGPDPAEVEESLNTLQLSYWTQDEDWLALTIECAQHLVNRVQTYKANLGFADIIPKEEIEAIRALTQ